MNTHFEVIVTLIDTIGGDVSNAEIISTISKMIEERLDADVISVEIIRRLSDEEVASQVYNDR